MSKKSTETILGTLKLYEEKLQKIIEEALFDNVIDAKEQEQIDKVKQLIEETRAQLNGSSAPSPTATSSEPPQPKKLLFEERALRYQTPEFLEKVKEVCQRLGMEPDFLMATMAAECNFNHKAVNKHTRATGLIQFMPFTAKELNTTVEALGAMSGIQQLDYVERYFKKFGKKLQQISEPAESYLFVFYPYAVGKPDSYVLGSQVSQERAELIAKQNGIYDLNKDGVITKGEIMEYMRKHKYKDVYDNWNADDNGGSDNSGGNDDNGGSDTVSIRPIGGSVGHKGKNDKEDTKIVQTLLNDNGASLTVDGLCGKGTINAIGKFQRDKMGMRKPDGRVDPNGRTWNALKDGASSSSSDDTTTNTGDDTTTNTGDDTTTDDTNVDTTPVDIRPIKQSVGKGGKNDPEDVKIIQTLLNKFGNNLATNGVCDAKTEAAIANFQAQRLGTRKPDGRVDPNGGTWKGLNGEKELKEELLPKGMTKPNWIKVAEGEMGMKENTSKTEHNPRVIEYHAATTGKFKNDETPWCSSFVNWVMKKAGQGGTDSAAAVSWARWGKKLDRPAYGAIAVIDWDGPGPGWKGHVGFVVGKNGSQIALLGGNQSNMVNIANFSESKIVAYVVPSNYEVPAAAYNIGGDIGGGSTDIASTR